jgi:hypothetical protein
VEFSLNTGPRLSTICLGLRDKPEDTLNLCLLKGRPFSSKAFPCYTRGITLDNPLNCRPLQASKGPNLAITVAFLVKGTNCRLNRGFLHSLIAILFNYGQREDN